MPIYASNAFNSFAVKRKINKAKLTKCCHGPESTYSGPWCYEKN